jgi:urea transport system permease protein
MPPLLATLRRLIQPRWPFLVMLVLLALAPLGLSDFRLNLLGKFLTFAIVALGLDLIWGYGGMLSLGQGLFFGLGAYAMAMYLKLEASGRHLPDFMVWSGRETLPLFWKPFYSPIFALSLAIIFPTLLAALLGYLVFRSRTRGVYFSIITQAFTLIVSILLIGQQAVTGGTNGITNLSTIFGLPLSNPKTQLVLYFVTVLCLVGIYALCRRLTHSRLGRLLVALRDDEDRVRFLGYNPVTIKTAIFALSAGISGLAGALFIPQVGIISPSALGVVPSIEMVIWVAVGGRGTLLGAIVGALLVSWGKSLFSESFPAIWQFFMGALFIGSVLLFPDGLLGAVSRLNVKVRALLDRRQSRSAPTATPPSIEPEAKPGNELASS